MIPAETRYKTHDSELLAIVEAFKTWWHYLEGCKYEVLVLTDHNNLYQIMDIKSLSSRQVRWAQELSWYYFQINYCQSKAIELQTLCFAFHKEVLRRKKSFKLRILKFFIVYSLHWQVQVLQVSAYPSQARHLSIKFLFAELTSFLSYVNFGILSEPS